MDPDLQPADLYLHWLLYRPLDKGVIIEKIIFSTKTYVVGTQKNSLNETFFLSTQNICLKLWVRTNLLFYDANFCLSNPVGYIIWV